MQEVPRIKGSITPAKSLWKWGKVLQEFEAKSPWKMGGKVLQELEAKVPGKWAKSFSWRQKVPRKWATKSFLSWRQKSLENGQSPSVGGKKSLENGQSPSVGGKKSLENGQQSPSRVGGKSPWKMGKVLQLEAKSP